MCATLALATVTRESHARKGDRERIRSVDVGDQREAVEEPDGAIAVLSV